MKKVAILLTLFLLTLSAFPAGSTSKKIKLSEKSLQAKEKEQKETSEQLDKIAREIKKAKLENQALNRKLEALSQKYSQNSKVYHTLKKTLTGYDHNLSLINQKIKEKNQIFVEVLANQSSIIYAMSQSHEPTRESIVMKEAYRLLKKQNTEALAKLKRQIDQNKAQKRKISKKRSSVKKGINKITKQRNEYKEQRTEKQKLSRRLAASEERYRKKLQRTMDQQSALRSTLADLNILHKKEVEEERRIAAEQKAAMLAEKKRKREERERRRRARDEARKKGEKVVYTAKAKPSKSRKKRKKLGSSYKKSKVYTYHGTKTISPIQGAKVVKRFGTYIDPIYKIKIFNESITLRAPSRNAKVHNILNGKVVFSGSSSMLGKVVVVSHSGRMHTVYAGLSKIAPNIRKGTRIKKGYVIGRVSRKLMFEVTKNSKHINPVKLIKL